MPLTRGGAGEGNPVVLDRHLAGFGFLLEDLDDLLDGVALRLGHELEHETDRHYRQDAIRRDQRSYP